MKKRVLILYSTRNGQTRKILDAMMAQRLEWNADFVGLHGLPDVDFTPYDKVIIAASIRYGYFHTSLNQFVRKNLQQLMQKESAFIGVNLVARKAGKNTPETNAYVRKWLKASPWKPTSAAVFAGALCYSEYQWWQVRIIQLIMRITGGTTDTSQNIEFTNWNDVQKFAEQFLN